MWLVAAGVGSTLGLDVCRSKGHQFSNLALSESLRGDGHVYCL
jgi:hypothetical protein